MDNSSQNNAGTEQKPETEQPNHYQQYLDNEPKNKPNKRLKLIIIAASIFAILIVIIIIAALLTASDKTPQTAQAPVPSNCADEACFSQKFAECSQAVYDYEELDNSVKYTITGVAEVGCNINFEYISGNNIPTAAGKKMACEFDNKVDFKTATQNVFLFPQDYNCSGELANLLLELNPPVEE